ncbi:MAG: RsiV family protein [Thermoanaerobacterales bacterium]|nr:RsiV family protein [Bacillota bacterium]MDI6907982.1 RsiV family protein [Thermoanaerobacterales bacterium]
MGLRGIIREYGCCSGGAKRLANTGGGDFQPALEGGENLDTRTGKTLLLKDFFKPGEDYQSLVAGEIRKQISARPQDFYEDAADRVKTIREDQPFYIKEGAVVVYFGQYEIAPYATGMPEFEIPVSAMP